MLPPTISSFSAAASTITAGSTTTLTGVFANGTGSVDQGVGTVVTGTPVTIAPTTTTLYTLTVTNALLQNVTRTANVTVVAAPAIASFTSSSTLIAAGASITLTGSFSGGTGLITNDVDSSARSVSSGVGATFTPARTTTYTLTITNAAGTSTTATVTVTVVSVTVAPFRTVVATNGTVNFTATVAGAAPMVSWAADGGTITGAGLFTAPAVPGAIGVSATSVSLPAARGDAIVSVLGSGLFGTAILHFVNAGAQTDLPMNLASNPVAAYVPAGDGGFTRFPGVGGSDGTFGIAGVPPGPAFVTIDGITHVWVDGGTLDFGAWRLGRANVQAPDAGTRLQLALTNMDPWYPGGNGSDDVQLYCEGAGLTTAYFLGAGLTPATGATSLTNTLDWTTLTRSSWRSGGLIESSRGDVLFVNHYRAANGSINAWWTKSLLETVSTNTLQMQHGATAMLAGPFAQAPVQSASFTMPLGQYNAFIPSVGPTPAFSSNSDFDVRTLPTLTHGAFADGALLTTMSLIAPSSPSTTAGVGGSYRNPFPSSWGTLVRATSLRTFALRQPTPGTATQYGYGGIQHLDTLASAQANGVAPVLQPVTAPTINGTSWTQATLTGVGLTPRFSWNAPAVGVPTSYRVDVVWHDWVGGQPVLVASMRVPSTVTSFRLPSGILQTGRNYSAVLVAERMPQSNFDLRPFDTSFPNDWSRVQSGLLTP